MPDTSANMYQTLSSVRQDVHELDKALLELLNKRFMYVKRIASLKMECGLEVTNENVELEKYKLVELVSSPEFLEENTEIMRCIIEMSKHMQRKMR